MRFILTLVASAILVFSPMCAKTGSGQSILFLESFDSVTPPDIPSGWLVTSAAWETSASSQSTGSGLNNIANDGNTTGALLSPVFDLSGVSSAGIRYLARRTSTYDVLSLSLDYSIDGGATFSPLLPAGSTLPSATSTWDTIAVTLPAAGASAVQFRFSADGQSGGNARIDDFAITGEGVIPVNSFGFTDADSESLEGVDHLIPLTLHYVSTGSDLQGLQCSVSFDSGRLSIVDVELAPGVPDPLQWSVSYETSGDTVRIVALASGLSGFLAAGPTEFLVLRASLAPLPGGNPETTDLTLLDVVGAFANPLGEDAQMQPSITTHSILVKPRVISFSASPDSVDFGTMAPGSTAQSEIRLSNPGATDTLSITNLTSTNSWFLPWPFQDKIGPDDSTTLVVSFSPDTNAIGLQSGFLIFEHNAPGSPDSVYVKAEVLEGADRGDINQDGYVNVADIVAGVDLVLGRLAAIPEVVTAADLYPFPEGGQGIDVRDLTVLSQAIALGQWPDGVVIPPTPAPMAKRLKKSGPTYRLVRSPEGVELHLESDVALRAFHFQFTSSLAVQALAPNKSHSGRTTLSVRQPASGSFSVLGYRLDGAPLSLDDPAVGTFRVETVGQPELKVASAFAVSESGQLLAVLESDDQSPADSRSLGDPYPNPFRPGRGLLTVAVRGLSGRSRVMVFDVLGRIVHASPVVVTRSEYLWRWDGHDSGGLSTPPGIYFIRVDAPDGSSDLRSVVLR